MRKALSRVHVGLAWGSVAAIVAQFFFAGLGIFGASSFAAHQVTGLLIVGAALVLLLLALAGRMGAMRLRGGLLAPAPPWRVSHEPGQLVRQSTRGARHRSAAARDST